MEAATKETLSNLTGLQKKVLWDIVEASMNNGGDFALLCDTDSYHIMNRKQLGGVITSLVNARIIYADEVTTDSGTFLQIESCGFSFYDENEIKEALGI